MVELIQHTEAGTKGCQMELSQDAFAFSVTWTNGDPYNDAYICTTLPPCVQANLTSWSKTTAIQMLTRLTSMVRQAIIWTKAGLLLIGPLGTNFSEILIEILTFSLKKIRLKVSSAKRRSFCLGLNVLDSPCIVSWLHLYHTVDLQSAVSIQELTYKTH